MDHMTRCWIITEGMKGTENQCLALAEAAGLKPEIKVVRLKQPWKTITPWIPFFNANGFAPGSSEFTAPWPDLIIASGRKAIAPALWIKKQSAGRTKLVIVQSPVIKNKNFDLVIAPRHDRYTGKNVLPITGALSLITPEKIASAKIIWASTLEQLPSPRIAVLIGGNSRTHKLSKTIVNRLIAQLKQLQAQNYGLMVTASRRTPEKFMTQMRNELSGTGIHFWDGTGDNPYTGYLAWADAILVTEDSVSMASEALSTGKSLYIIPMDGGSPRFKRFHDDLFRQKYARWFDGKIEEWNYSSPNDMDKAAKILTY